MNLEAKRIGLIAGWGRFPIVVAQALGRQGFDVHCIALKNHADEQLRSLCTGYYECAIPRLGFQLAYLQRQGITRATLAGKVFKDKLLFGRHAWLNLIPDWRTFQAFSPLFLRGKKDRRDDTLLTVIVEEFARGGVTLAPATDFAPELLVNAGQLTRRAPTAAQRLDIQFGWQLAKEMGRLDVGQSVAVKGRAVIAVEAVEGTDECIRRAGQLCPQGGFTVVKVAKPQQDMRFDVPTIGVGTITTLAAAGGSVLAIEAGKTIVIDQAEVIALAEKHGIALLALDDAS